MGSAGVPVADRPASAPRWFRLARTPPSPERLLNEIRDGHDGDLSNSSEEDEPEADDAAMKGKSKDLFQLYSWTL